MQTNILIKIDKNLKEKTRRKAKNIGLNLSNVTKLLYTHFVESPDIKVDFGEIKFDEMLKRESVKNQLIGLGKAIEKHVPNNSN
jgi:antitoxin component of RelBE/YafQ-DinJ toxin-antitoxin module